MVIVDAASAGRLQAEGALCLDAHTLEITQWGARTELPEDASLLERPILVCGADDRQVEALVRELTLRGLPAWQVVS
ncbi:hypothetical protein FHX74_000496 [Friedmanniella endophytica]|uniref:Uncharacterized protein n=1 Tax=Microlunatus kandeliicorticis TaxID=1759536 RepID=A0A7W3IPK5_9ACTN|nr:hypothetical protein [Microlunatus kandeliicorticis]MBA8792902.1 hypothetical protein [Microlunatus kandeliicorticis]